MVRQPARRRIRSIPIELMHARPCLQSAVALSAARNIRQQIAELDAALTVMRNDLPQRFGGLHNYGVGSLWLSFDAEAVADGAIRCQHFAAVPATWFGRTTAPHADFEVLDCGTLRLPQTNASLVVYLPSRRHPPTCQVLPTFLRLPLARNCTAMCRCCELAVADEGLTRHLSRQVVLLVPGSTASDV